MLAVYLPKINLDSVYFYKSLILAKEKLKEISRNIKFSPVVIIKETDIEFSYYDGSVCRDISWKISEQKINNDLK